MDTPLGCSRWDTSWTQSIFGLAQRPCISLQVATCDRFLAACRKLPGRQAGAMGAGCRANLDVDAIKVMWGWINLEKHYV